MPVSFPCHPSGASEMALERPPRPIRFAVGSISSTICATSRPGGTFRIRVEHAHVGDGMLIVVRGELGLGGRAIGDVRIEGGMDVCRVGKEEAGAF